MKLVQALNNNNTATALQLVTAQSAAAGKKRASTSVGMARKAVNNALSAQNFHAVKGGKRGASRPHGNL